MTVKTCQLTVRLRSPLLVGDESAVGNYEQTVDHIPGTVLRGAMGARLLETCSQHDHRRDHASCPDRDTCAFWRVFGAEHSPHFCHAYPATRGQGFPFPTTARTCKYHDGYRHRRINPDGHGVFDILVEQFVYDLVSDPCFPHRADLLPDLGQDWADLPAHYDPLCPECGAAVKPQPGYYLLDGTPGYTPQPIVSRATHVGINRARGVAEDALLFTLETVEPATRGQTVFRGRLTYDDEYADALGQVLDLNGGGGDFFIGRGRSRGLGHVTVTVAPPPDSTDSLEDRLFEFDYALRQALRPYHDHDDRVPERLDGTFFSLTLRAPAILTAADGTPSLWPDLDALNLSAARALQAWARTTLVGGWDAAGQLPRATRKAVEPGAVYLLYVPQGAMKRQALEDCLRKLEQTGLGQETERGYGQVTVCAPFHYAGWRR